MGFYLIALAIVLTDQATKAVVVRTMRLGQSIAIVPGYLDLTFVLNPGAAFSLLATLPERIRNPFFILISVAAAVLIIVILMVNTIANMIMVRFRAKVT